MGNTKKNSKTPWNVPHHHPKYHLLLKLKNKQTTKDQEWATVLRDYQEKQGKVSSSWYRKGDI